MTTRDSDIDVLGLMAAHDPVAAGAFATTITDPEVELAMAETIGRAERERPGWVPRPRMALGLGAGLACVCAVAAVILLGGGGSVGTGEHPAYAEAAIKVAEANPRLLVTAPGWAVSKIYELDVENGEIQFSDGDSEHHLAITWYPARLYNGYLEDRAQVSTPEASTVLDHSATTVHYGGTEYATMLSPWGNVFIEIRGDVGDKEAYDDVIQSLRSVDVDTWLAAFPVSVVQPDDHAATVDSMLLDIPLPPGFDVDALRQDNSVFGRVAVETQVANAVSCDWIDRWVAAQKSGDTAAADAAVKAMSTARDWAILREIADGDTPYAAHQIWSFAEDIKSGDLSLGPAAIMTREDGTSFAYAPPYAMNLGCDSAGRHRIDN
jgi:hypothetical protein